MHGRLPAFPALPGVGNRGTRRAARSRWQRWMQTWGCVFPAASKKGLTDEKTARDGNEGKSLKAAISTAVCTWPLPA